MIQIGEDVDGLAFLRVGLVGKPIRHPFVVILLSISPGFQPLPTILTLPCKVLRRVSRFLMFASATGTDTAGPVALPVDWS